METSSNNRNYHKLHNKIRKAIVDNCNIKEVFGKYPTLDQIKECVKDIDWDSFTDLSCLSEELKKMGYYVKYCTNLSSHIIVEDPNIVSERYFYLSKKLETYKTVTDMIYIDGTWVDDSLTFDTCYDLNEKGTAIDNRFLYITVASSYVSRQTLSFYCNDITKADFSRWVIDILLDLLTKPTLIIFNNASYTMKLLNPPPSKFSTKIDMISWLESNNIPFSSNMRKAELYALIEEFKRNRNEYQIDKALKAYGHEVLRIPQHMTDSNMITYAWRDIKCKVSNIEGMPVINMVSDLISKVPRKDWRKYFKCVNSLDFVMNKEDFSVEKALDMLTLEQED